jgi:hypothetical protein
MYHLVCLPILQMWFASIAEFESSTNTRHHAGHEFDAVKLQRKAFHTNTFHAMHSQCTCSLCNMMMWPVLELTHTQDATSWLHSVPEGHYDFLAGPTLFDSPLFCFLTAANTHR